MAGICGVRQPADLSPRARGANDAARWGSRRVRRYDHGITGRADRLPTCLRRSARVRLPGVPARLQSKFTSERTRSNVIRARPQGIFRHAAGHRRRRSAAVARRRRGQRRRRKPAPALAADTGPSAGRTEARYGAAPIGAGRQSGRGAARRNQEAGSALPPRSSRNSRSSRPSSSRTRRRWN